MVQSLPDLSLWQAEATAVTLTKETFAKAAEAQGFNPYTQEVLSITAMEKRIGKKQFAELFSAYVEKPEGTPVLVPESDKREELSTAKHDFMEEM